MVNTSERLPGSRAYSGAIEHFDVLRDAASGAQAAITALEAVRQSERPVEHRH